MNKYKTTLILTLLTITSCHATLQVATENKADPTCSTYLIPKNKDPLINGFHRESYLKLGPEINIFNPIPSDIIDIIAKMLAPFFIEGSDLPKGEKFCFIKFVGDFLVTATKSGRITLYKYDSDRFEMCKEIKTGIPPFLRSAIIYNKLLFLGLVEGRGINPNGIIKVLNPEDDFSEFKTINFHEIMKNPCAHFDLETGTLFTIGNNSRTVYPYSTEDFRKTRFLKGLDYEINDEVSIYCIESTGEVIFTGNALGRVEKHDKKKSESCLMAFHMSESRVRCLVYSPKLELLFCSWGCYPGVAVFNPDGSLVTYIGECKINKVHGTQGYQFDPGTLPDAELQKEVVQILLNEKESLLFVVRENNTIDIYDGNHFKDCKDTTNKVAPTSSIKPSDSEKSSLSHLSIDPSRQIMVYACERKKGQKGQKVAVEYFI